METIIAYCGMICSECPSYIATQADDQAALEAVAAQQREMWNAPEISVASVICDGCLGGPKKCSYCAECEIRECGIQHVVANCAYCTAYPCGQLESFFGMFPDTRLKLDQIHQSL